MSEKNCRCCGDKCNFDGVYENGPNHEEHDHDEHEHSHEHSHSHDLKTEKKRLLVSAAAYFILLISSHMFSVPYLFEAGFLVLYFFCGYSVIKDALRSIKEKDFFNEFTLMFLATSVAIIINQMPEAVGVMLFYKVGEYLQELATQRSKNSIKELITSKPNTANLIVGDEVREIKVEDIIIGQKFLVKSGEKIPTDSVIVKGSSQIDTSSLTGEFMPIVAKTGDEILGGCINMGSVITVEAVREFKDTSISRTMELIESSSKHKAPTEKFITRFARYYTPIVFFAAILVAIIPPLLMGASWNTWIYRALVMLVISCPCALVISIPLSYFASIGIASRKGILVKGGVIIDAAKDVDMVIFDKTGTITKGELKVTAMHPAKGVHELELVDMAVYIEAYSNHPISKAILKLRSNKVTIDKAARVEEVAGKGLVVKAGGKTYLAGRASFLNEYGIYAEEAKDVGTHIYFAEDGEYKGYAVLNDTIKKEAKSTIAELKKQGITTFMLTGDNEKAAEYVASKIGLDGYEAGLLPEGKLKEAKKFYDKNKILFVGDGVNDAPLLSSVHIGVAMGGLGSKLAVEVADAVILNDDISKIPTLINLAKKTHSIVWQNIIMALGVKTLFMVLGVVGMSGLWEAVFADVGVSLLAIFNALRLARH